ncbi:hypothetical protein ENE75_03575 [Rubrivivax albus]|uniref:Uncharacterized protein n=2 Tax=Rubrivivax albus TaxID=2499835 RepID=A0A3S2TSX4_9BURK|nr:hypothetical protein ENE75_03575 [Rubrivivax albus]
MTDDQLANALYGSVTEHDVEPPREQAQQAPADSDELARRMYQPDDPGAHVGEDRLDKVYGSVQRQIETAAVEQLGLEPDVARQASTEWAQVFRENEISTDEAATLSTIAAGLVGGSVQPDPIAWRNAARAELVSEYGANSEAALAAAKAFVAKDRALAEFLDEHGLGDHPAVVRTIARRAWTLKKAGKL